MTRLEATLDDIVGKLRDNLFPNEQSVSYGIVLRVLRDLNWDADDPTVVSAEYKLPNGKRVDFALCHPANKPQVFIEVKQPGAAVGGLEQVFNYTYFTTVEYAVLTDGRTWRFYLPRDKGDPEERCVHMLDLLQTSTSESADALQRYLERNGIVSGQIHRVASEELKSRRNRANIRKTWNSLIDKHERSLIDLLANSTQAETGDRPEDTDVVNFLASLHQRTSVSTPPPPSEEPEKPWNTAAWWPGRIIRSTCTENPRKFDSKGWHSHNFIMSHADGVSYEDYRAAGYTLNHLKWDLERNYITAEYNNRNVKKDDALTTKTTIETATNRRGGTLRILGEEAEYAYPMDALHMILKRLQKDEPNFFSKFYSHPRNKGKDGMFVAKNPKKLYGNAPALRKYQKPLGDGWLFATYIGKREQKIILEIAAEVAGLTLGHDIVVDF